MNRIPTMKTSFLNLFLIGIFLLNSACTKKNNTNNQISALDKEQVIDDLVTVNNKWQSEHPDAREWPFWHNAAYHIGNLAAYKLTDKKDYLDYTITWAEHNEWQGAKSENPEEWKFMYGETDDYVLFGDWQACFQVYIDLYELEPAEYKIARAKEVMSYQVGTDEDGYWWWIDGLYMVMPVMPRMYELTGNEIYLEKLFEYYSFTKEQVYDEEAGLWYRDAKYIYPEHKTKSGKKDFWSRGDGWVFAAHARTLDKLTEDAPYRDEYIEVFKSMAEALKAAQQPEGYWTRSLLDPEQAPGPETSGTAFFTYGMLWGMNAGILPIDEYESVAFKAWDYLSETAIQPDGTLGYVQPIGEKAADGQIVNENSTSDFGVGAFLLAATEMVHYLEGK